MENFNKNIIETEIKESNNYIILRKYLAAILILAMIATGVLGFYFFNDKPKEVITEKTSSIIEVASSPTPLPIPANKILSNGDYHIFQSFNNCGPAALSMALRFYGINVSQEVLGQALRPYQVPSGDNDDKSVTLEEVAEKSKDYDLIPYLRPMGTEQTLKKFIAEGIPVITRTWTKPNEDIGHFRIIKGYDEAQEIFIQDDSLQGKNLKYSYSDFDEIWKKFNYEYLVLVPREKQKIAQQIIGEDFDEIVAWKKAKDNSLTELNLNPNDVDARFNLSVAYYKLGENEKSVEEFEKIEDRLSFRTLWYQLDPILAYFELGEDNRVLQITEQILNNQNRAFSELYILRGKIYQKRGNNELAKQEFQKAVLYNSNLQEAQKLLSSV